MFKFQRILMGLIIFGHLVVSMVVMAAGVEQEPNDKFGQALLINGQLVYEGTLDNNRGSDIDYYKVIIKENGVLTVNLGVDNSLDDLVKPYATGYELSTFI